ncbi:hypothetical protein E4N85_05115 [Treponema denticola]|uniref:hypothetical protein n=1 Tax=Treponema denticola TaxID=158 RepID=UPI0020A558B4|nr:hypothetical protein [Treponema denticola]UTC95145.1 hypothetical protein E4N85_05115 [Treponema denticola]
MKRILFPILFFVLIFTSCSLFFQEEYGTIKIDLEGGKARSINSSTGLPNLADSELEIDIVTDGNSSIYKKILASEPKFFQADFPIGSRLEITVKLNGPSASWSAHNSLTVKEGNNNIQLLLNKNASSLANVGFSTKAANTYEFNIAGKTIDISSNTLPVFTRDSRGRLYIAYKQSAWALNRYESDGTPNNFASSSQILSTITSASSVKLASDPITGKVYAAANSNLYLIKDDGSVIAGSPTIPAGPIAVYNNNLFALDSPASTDLKMFTITEVGSVLTLNQAGSPVSVSRGQITISGTPGTTINVDFKDILVKNDKIYILFAKNSLPSGTPPAHYYSLGGMLEYTYNSSGVIDNPQKYGFNDTVTAGDDIVTAGEANFYGPACFIGYDEQSISIADDGCTFKKEGGSVRIYKNVNRIFSFNTSTKSLYSYATENKWFKEYKVTGGSTPSPGTGKVLLWQKNTDSNLGMVYYQVDEGGYTGLPTAFIAGSNTGGNIEDPTDVFCYDQEGNLYVVWNNTSNFYCVRRYEKKSDGSYDTANVKEQALKGSGSTYLNSSNPPIAIAVDVSDSTNGYLYYGYKDGTNTPMRISRWNKTNFETVIENKNVQIDNKFKITAMAANKEGAFVAVKQNYTTPPAGYKINILKYKNDSSSHGYWYFYNSAQNHSSGDNYKDENIFAMKVVNDILFFLITRQKGQMNNLSTNTVKIEAELWRTQYPLSGNFNDQRYQDLWKSKDEDHQHGYAPYRFIGTVPNKLIIASDGYYGDKSSIGNEAQNKNKVLSFGIGSWTVTPTDTNAKFSRELTYGSSGFEWK